MSEKIRFEFEGRGSADNIFRCYIRTRSIYQILPSVSEIPDQTTLYVVIQKELMKLGSPMWKKWENAEEEETVSEDLEMKVNFLLLLW